MGSRGRIVVHAAIPVHPRIAQRIMGAQQEHQEPVVMAAAGADDLSVAVELDPIRAVHRPVERDVDKALRRLVHGGIPCGGEIFRARRAAQAITACGGFARRPRCMGDGAAVGQRLYEAALRVRRPAVGALLTRNGQEPVFIRVLRIMPVIFVHERRLGREMVPGHAVSLTDMVSCRTGAGAGLQF